MEATDLSPSYSKFFQKDLQNFLASYNSLYTTYHYNILSTHWYNSFMQLPWYVILKSKLLHYFPLIGRKTAQSLGPIILIPDPIYRDLQTNNPHPQHVGLLIHEETHRKRQKEMGYVQFAFRYIFNPRFRFQEELLAVKEAMKYLKKNKVTFDFNKNAKFLSSYVYLWPVSKHYAEKELKKVWDEI